MKKTLVALTALALLAGPVGAQTAALTFVEKQTSAEVLGTDFIGTSVVTKDGVRIGSIANLVFDQNGHIELAVIGVGGFLGVGSKEVAVPFDSLRSEIQSSKHVLVIDATKEQLQAAPSYQTLNDMARQEKLAEWRAKASESWKRAKEKAGEAYESAKARVNEMREENGQAEK